MKNKTKKIIAITSLVFAVIAISGCENKKNKPTINNPVMTTNDKDIATFDKKQAEKAFMDTSNTSDMIK